MAGLDTDIAVIGAGVAGSVAAITAAQQANGRASITLFDRQVFPREKVCGCCLNRRALAALTEAGADDAVTSLGGVELERVRLRSGGLMAELRLPGGRAISRGRLDMALARLAERRGVVWRAGLAAHIAAIEDDAAVIDTSSGACRAGVVIVADGLGGTALRRLAGFEVDTRAASRVGLGAIAPSSRGLEPGVVEMTTGAGGYVGAVVLEDGRLDVAAAVDASQLKRHGGPGGAVAAIIDDAGGDPSGLASLTYTVTPRLTRRRRSVAGHRVLVVGDAAGYVEPFTGEGMAWAARGGVIAAGLAAEAAQSGWRPELTEQWTRIHRRRIVGRQRVCRGVASVLRRPALTRAAVRLAAFSPTAAAPLIRHAIA